MHPLALSPCREPIGLDSSHHVAEKPPVSRTSPARLETCMAREMIRSGRFLAVVLCVVGLIPLGGCRAKNRVSVKGTVTLDGKPLESGILLFSPDASKGNTARVTCTCAIKDGSYELRSSGVTRSESSSRVPPGWYKVTVTTNEPGKSKAQAKIQINDRYKNPEKSPLSIEVVANPEPGQYDIKLDK